MKTIIIDDVSRIARGKRAIFTLATPLDVWLVESKRCTMEQWRPGIEVDEVSHTNLYQSWRGMVVAVKDLDGRRHGRIRVHKLLTAEADSLTQEQIERVGYPDADALWQAFPQYRGRRVWYMEFEPVPWWRGPWS